VVVSQWHSRITAVNSAFAPICDGLLGHPYGPMKLPPSTGVGAERPSCPAALFIAPDFTLLMSPEKSPDQR
jgi:hypothetical protein